MQRIMFIHSWFAAQSKHLKLFILIFYLLTVFELNSRYFENMGQYIVDVIEVGLHDMNNLPYAIQPGLH